MSIIGGSTVLCRSKREYYYSATIKNTFCLGSASLIIFMYRIYNNVDMAAILFNVIT